MTTQQHKAYIEESETVELKEQATVNAVGPSVAAMLNGRGGTVYVGFSAHGEHPKLTGDPVLLAERLTAELTEAIVPQESFQVVPSMPDGEGRFGLMVEVPPGVRKPYIYNGQIFVRVGAADRLASSALLTQMLNERERLEDRWERRAALGVDAELLDRSEIARTMHEAERRYAYSGYRETSALANLERLDMAQDGWPTQGAVVLFKSQAVRRYPQVMVQAAVFTGYDLSLLEHQTFGGGAFSQFEGLAQFLQMRLPMASHLPNDSVVRQDQPTYPVPVIREAIVNALMHRDYGLPESVQVRVFPNRMEVWNPGHLPEEYVHGTSLVSHPHNPDIARMFYLRRLAEMMGIGIVRIRQEMAQANLPPPEWKNEAGGVLLILYRAPKVAAPFPSLEVSPRLSTFLEATAPGDRFTRERYRSQYAPDISERSARNDLKAMQEMGYLRQVGRGYQTAYVRTEKRFR